VIKPCIADKFAVFESCAAGGCDRCAHLLAGDVVVGWKREANFLVQQWLSI